MKHISHYLRQLGLMKPEAVVEVNPLEIHREVYQIGWKNGYAWGEVVGRRDALADLLHQLHVHGRVVDDLTEDDVKEAQVRSTH